MKTKILKNFIWLQNIISIRHRWSSFLKVWENSYESDIFGRRREFWWLWSWIHLRMLSKCYENYWSFASWKKMHKYIFTPSFAYNFRSPLRINWIKYINQWLQQTFSCLSECYHSLWRISFYSSVPFPPFALMLFMNIVKDHLKIPVLLFFYLVLVWKNTIKRYFKKLKSHHH